MADRKISELTNITGANLADADEFVIVDASADETKALTFAELRAGLDTATGFVRITGDTMTGDLITTGLTVNAGGENLVAQFTSTDSLAYVSFSDDSTTSSTSVAVGASGDNFALYTGTSYGQERLRVTSGGFVGIGESDPDRRLHVNSGTTNEVAKFESTDGTAYLSIMDSNTTYSLHGIGAAGDSLTFYANNGERARVDSSGNILLSQSSVIGANTSGGSDDQAVYLSGGGTESVSRGGSVRVFGNNESNTGDVQIYSGNASTSNITLNAYGSNSTIQFTIDNGGEAARFDASRNFLVGVTSLTGSSGPRDTTTTAGIGVGLNYYGGVYAATYQNSAFVSNRISNDGEMFTFKKDGLYVGGIGSADSGDRIYLGGKSTNRGVGIDSSASAFLPTTNTGGLNDSIMTLGTSSSRWSDVYASAATVNQYNNEEALPDIRPSLLLDFANSKTLDPRITFTRGSTATYWDGRTKTKAEENLHLHSQSTSDKSEFNFTFANNNATAPDGTTTATLLTADSSGTGGPRYYGTSNTNGQRAFVSGETYTVSAYFKAGTTTYCYIAMRTSSGNIAASEFNLSTGSASTATKAGSFSNHSSSMTNVGNGWYRCTLTATAGATTTDGYNFFGVSDGTGISSGGYPNITLSGQTVYIWGLQKERNSSVTTYTATTSQAIVKYQPTLQTAVSGEPRFDHDPVTGESKGLLIEEARTNLHSTSENAASNTGLNAVGTISNNAIAPDGTRSADFVYPTVGTQRHEIQPRWSSTSGVTYAFSAYLKAVGTVTEVSFSQTGGGVVTALFDLENGTVTNRGSQSGSYAEIEDAGNGWYRCILVGDATSSNSNYSMYISLGDGGETLGSGSTVFTTLPANGANGILIWGVQVEAGAFATSYIPTDGSTVTRSADSSYMDITKGTFGDGLTVYAEIDDAPKGYFPRIIALQDTTGTAGPFDFYTASGNAIGNDSITARIYAFSGAYANLSVSYLSRKLAAAYDVTGISAMSDANSTVQTDSSIVFPQADKIRIGSYSNTNGMPNIGIKKIALYPKKLSDATLQAMTKE